MADLTFNTTAGQTVDRALLILYLNTGESGTPVWSPIGKRVEDSSAEYDWGKETKTDIFGEVYTTLKKPTQTQSFEPCELDAGDAAQQKIWNLGIKEQNAQALANLDMLVVHLYAGTKDTAVFAERYSSCAVEPTSLGGRGRRQHRYAHRGHLRRHPHHRHRVGLERAPSPSPPTAQSKR